MHGHTATSLFAGLALRQGRAPTGLFRRELQHAQMPWLARQQSVAERDRVLAGRGGKLVDKRFGRKRGMRRAERTPPPNGHANLWRMKIDPQIGNRIGERGSALDRGGVDAVFYQHFLER